MLSENIKTLRKQKGYSQETLAAQLHVVRQTVSKWEKGLSVPDAEMLNRMAELFEVPVSALLGGPLPEQEETVSPEMAEVAKQLAVLNEQLADQAARRRKTWRRVLIGIPAALLILFVLYMGMLLLYRYNREANTVLSQTSVECTVDGETHGYEFVYDQNYHVREAGGDEWVYDHILYDVHGAGDLHVYLAAIEDYCKKYGGTFRIIEEKEVTD